MVHRVTRGRRLLRFGSSAAAATLALLAAGCAPTSSASASGASAVSSQDLAALKRQIQQAQQEPQFKPQGPAFSIASLKGKKILSIPVSSQLKGCDDMARQVVDIAKSVGLTGSSYFQNNGGPQAWVQGMNLAINQHYNGVALVCGIDPASLAPQMAAAKAAGIKVVDMHLADVSDPASPLIAAQTNGQFDEAMRMGVASALVRAGGKRVDALVVTSNENPPSVGMEKTVKQTFLHYCKSCAVQSINVPIADYATKLTSAVSSALVRNPNIKAVFTVYDAQAPFVQPALRASHSGALTYAFGGAQEAVSLMADKSNPTGSDMGPSYPWMAYSGADQLFRVLAGQPPIPAKNAYAPYRMFTPENVSEFTSPDYGFGHSYVEGYRSLWLK